MLLLAQRLPRKKRDGWKGVTLGASTSSKAQGRAGVVGGEAEESAQRSARGQQNEQAESGAQKDGETPARALGEDVALSQSSARVGEARGLRAVTDERSEEKSPLGAADDEDEEMASMSEGELYSDDDEPLDCGEGGEDAVGEGATVGEAEDWMLGFEEGDWARTEEMGDGVQELVSMEE